MASTILSLYTGRILNRFIKDLGCMDDQLPQYFLDTIFVNSLNKLVSGDNGK